MIEFPKVIRVVLQVKTIDSVSEKWQDTFLIAESASEDERRGVVHRRAARIARKEIPKGVENVVVWYAKLNREGTPTDESGWESLAVGGVK